MSEPYYAQPADLRTELDVDSTVLTDDRAIALITDAEDIVDDLLGAWPINLTTGRKISNVGAFDWQLTKLNRATVKVAALVYNDPATFRQRQYRSVRGPDFSFTDPIGGPSPIGTDILTVLNASGLRRLTTRATPRISQGGLALISSQVANGPDEIEDDEGGSFDQQTDGEWA